MYINLAGKENIKKKNRWRVSRSARTLSAGINKMLLDFIKRHLGAASAAIANIESLNPSALAAILNAFYFSRSFICQREKTDITELF